MPGFAKFAGLPTELRVKIWHEALLEDSRKRIVPFHSKGCVVMPIPSLVSPYLRVNSESRQEAKNFYEFRLRVYDCKRLDRNGAVGRGRVRGALYLTLKRDTILICPQLTMDLFDEEQYEWIKGEYEGIDERYPFNVPLTHVTSRFSKRRLAQVSRSYETVFPHNTGLPTCCWGCSYRDERDDPDAEIEAQESARLFPNVWLSRLIVVGFEGHDEISLLVDLAALSPQAFWDEWYLQFVTCDVPPVRRVGGSDWEPDPDYSSRTGSDW